MPAEKIPITASEVDEILSSVESVRSYIQVKGARTYTYKLKNVLRKLYKSAISRPDREEFSTGCRTILEKLEAFEYKHELSRLQASCRKKVEDFCKDSPDTFGELCLGIAEIFAYYRKNFRTLQEKYGMLETQVPLDQMLMEGIGDVPVRQRKMEAQMSRLKTSLESSVAKKKELEKEAAAAEAFRERMMSLYKGMRNVLLSGRATGSLEDIYTMCTDFLREEGMKIPEEPLSWPPLPATESPAPAPEPGTTINPDQNYTLGEAAQCLQDHLSTEYTADLLEERIEMGVIKTVELFGQDAPRIEGRELLRFLHDQNEARKYLDKETG
ncbi:MAG: hypothetical protein ACE5FW_02530 [Candidatus Aenigmatarchaeota archaeon]